MIVILVVWFILIVLGICLLKVGSGEPLSPPRKENVRLSKVTLKQLNKLLLDGTKGYCTHCGKFQHDVAPKARNLYCKACNNYTLFGVGELVALRQARVVDLAKKKVS